ncbi:VOC family protein [Nocardioides alcanivorans]|uniref:VOC family protein n=1 Tax=Nocardioides alcanivorans TaxID=2897352 RepID=UPI001F2317AD|nr:VOC family protein [Nocardioides alcanivorans]
MKLASPGLDVGIVVTDVERSLEFYRDLLCLPVRGDMQVPAVGRLVLLDLGVSTLKLVQRDCTVEHLPVPGGVRARAAGMRYVTFSVADIADVVERCRSAGHRVGMEPTRMAPALLVAAVEDPDRTWIEFTEATS